MNNYEKMCKDFKLELPEKYNFGFDVVDKWARDRTKLALVWVDADGKNCKNFTFWEIKTLSDKFANVLKSHSLKKGDCALLMLPRIPEWHIAMVGMIRRGVVPMPATTLLTAKDIKYRINQAKAKLVITDFDNMTKINEIRDKCPSLKTLINIGMSQEKIISLAKKMGTIETLVKQSQGWLGYEDEMEEASSKLDQTEKTKSSDIMLLYFTSGTEGDPKMVVHEHSYALAHTITAKFWHDLKPTDLHWTLTDTGWAKAAWGTIFGQWIMGAAVFVHNAKGRFSAKLTLKLLGDYGITTFCAPPTAYRMMVLEDLKKYDLSQLRHSCSAGEPLNPEVMKTWKQGTGTDIYDGYGQTETVNLLANFPGMPIRPGSMGKPAPGFYVSVVDEKGRELPPGKEGYVAVKVKPVRPVGLFREYRENSEEMRKVFQGNWYYTGDKAYKDKDGYFWFIGRADDIIISGGYRIGPFEVESALVKHPAVAEAAVVASPDKIRGEIVKAFVILAPGYNSSEELTKTLQSHVKKETAPYKYPRAIEYVEELPKTPSGKIKRKELKKMEWEKVKCEA